MEWSPDKYHKNMVVNSRELFPEIYKALHKFNSTHHSVKAVRGIAWKGWEWPMSKYVRYFLPKICIFWLKSHGCHVLFFHHYISSDNLTDELINFANPVQFESVSQYSVSLFLCQSWRCASTQSEREPYLKCFAICDSAEPPDSTHQLLSGR